MLSHLFLGLSLVGAEWVLYFLLLLSILSIALMFERAFFFRGASKGLTEFRELVRTAVNNGKWDDAAKAAETRVNKDLESGLTLALIKHARLSGSAKTSAAVLGQVAHDSMLRAKLDWERNLALLATIGSNAPFVGLFGTVLGIIKAFHDLSQQVGAGVQTVTAGIAEALIATAIGILVAIPAVVAFNLFQRRVRSAMAQAEALKSFLIGKMAE